MNALIFYDQGMTDETIISCFNMFQDITDSQVWCLTSVVPALERPIVLGYLAPGQPK